MRLTLAYLPPWLLLFSSLPLVLFSSLLSPNTMMHPRWKDVQTSEEFTHLYIYLHIVLYSPLPRHPEYPVACCEPSPRKENLIYLFVFTPSPIWMWMCQKTIKRYKVTTFEQTKSTKVGSSSPMYSIIFLLIHGRTRRSIKIWKKNVFVNMYI